MSNEIVFISGSINIDVLPKKVTNYIDELINKNVHILIGDARGVDSLVCNFLISRSYRNVTIYGIYNLPRNCSGGFNYRRVEITTKALLERVRQRSKDKIMTRDSTHNLVVWDGYSIGSEENIRRGLALGKKVKVFLANKNIWSKVERPSYEKYIDN